MHQAPFHFVAVYSDGELFYQIDPITGKESSGEQIDRAHVTHLMLRDAQGRTIVVQHYDPGQRVIYRRRTQKPMDGSPSTVCHMLGWQQTIEGHNVQHVYYVFESGPGAGEIHSAGRFREDHPWFYGIEPVPADLVEVGSNA